MVDDLKALADRYRDRSAGLSDPSSSVLALYQRYTDRFQSTIVNTITMTIKIRVIVEDGVPDAVTPQMREAFHLAFPGRAAIDKIRELRELPPTDEVRIRSINALRGRYFEILVRDQLNSGEAVGDVALGGGETAILAERLDHSAWELKIVGDDGLVDAGQQLKAVKIANIRRVLERFPDIEVIPADATASVELADRIIPGNIRNDEIETGISDVIDSPAGNAVEDILELAAPGLPFVVIAMGEGRAVITGRRTFSAALRRLGDKGTITGAVMGIGMLAASVGGTALTIPAVMMARLGIARNKSFAVARRKLSADHALVRLLLR